MKYKRLGEILVEAGVLTEQQIEQALQLQKTSGKRLGTVLIENKFITEMQLIDTLRMQLGIDFVDLNNAKIDPAMVKYIPKNTAKQYRIVPFKVQGDRLWIAMDDPLNFHAIEAAREVSKRRITPFISNSEAISRALSVLYENEGAAIAIEQMKEERGISSIQQIDTLKNESASNAAPTVKLVNSIIERGIAEKASDIHVEPRENQMVVRIRVDGRLTEVLEIPKELQAAVISRFKVMADMNITERRIPQDGRAIIRKADGKVVDLRLSTLPTIYGEKVVIRILQRDQKTLTRRGIGITERDNAKFDRILQNSAGMILIVGPTGSGKTSTLYTMIQELKNDSVNMISLEDPVEFQIDGVTQVAINEKVGLTFASALRSCLRQDPDIICVGEIRDGETAEIAMQAAMTGHLVLSTIHTEDAISAIDRLKDLGIEPYLIGGSVRGIISQRLVRRICPSCKQEVQPSEHLLDLAGMKKDVTSHYYKGSGCHLCFNTGYRGRTGVFEILTMNRTLRDAIASGMSSSELRKVVSQSGEFVSMMSNARDLVKNGITTLDEVVRVVATIE